jgi:hypothetical protein
MQLNKRDKLIACLDTFNRMPLGASIFVWAIRPKERKGGLAAEISSPITADPPWDLHPQSNITTLVVR